MKVSICIPMYNEKSIIADTARTLDSYMSANFDDYEIIFSDDGSTDDSGEIVRSLSLSRVRVVGYEHNRGKGCAVRTAFLAAEGDVAIFTDSDLAYGCEVIGEFVDKFIASPETDAIIGSRNLSPKGYEGYTFLRKLASKAYIKLLATVGGLKLSDSQSGCKGFRGGAARAVFSRCEVDGWAFDFEAILIAQKLGYKIAELPVKIINHRESKIHVFSDSIKMVSQLRGIKKRVRAMKTEK